MSQLQGDIPISLQENLFSNSRTGLKPNRIDQKIKMAECGEDDLKKQRGKHPTVENNT
jgi:hypothetical protein